MRILIAFEHGASSHFLKGIVREKNGVIIVGQADNVANALTLARKLRPDVAIIDCYLPYTIGMDSVPLSRSGGLDVAQLISEEIPNTKVMLLNNLDDVRIPESWQNSDTVVSFARETIAESIPLDLHDLTREPKNGPVFARVEIKRQPDLKKKRQVIADEISLFGGLGIICGLIMMLTIVLMVPGIVVTSFGLILAISGYLIKIVSGKFFKGGN